MDVCLVWVCDVAKIIFLYINTHKMILFPKYPKGNIYWWISQLCFVKFVPVVVHWRNKNSVVVMRQESRAVKWMWRAAQVTWSLATFINLIYISSLNRCFYPKLLTNEEYNKQLMIFILKDAQMFLLGNTDLNNVIRRDRLHYFLLQGLLVLDETFVRLNRQLGPSRKHHRKCTEQMRRGMGVSDGEIHL